ncbi:MAG: family 10 glycosylhydrolase [Chitinophagaceae bacterium]|nr:family 10 glycosylhydrolase [Chitinophagaceae bacterium]
MRTGILILLCLVNGIVVLAQSSAPKREFRAAWVATVGNIDWPSKKGLPSDLQKQEFIDILERLKANHLNAVIVQIRPAADALYDSPYENWSRYLSGVQGQPPSPYYDPLSFMIEESHKRNIEFHAWFNPFRALVEAGKNPNTKDHVTFQHPEWFVKYGDKLYFDPGIPEVRAYFIKIVLDVVKRYDLDAVHFDDYFYPYRIAKVEFPDAKSYTRYGQQFTVKDDWRRDNVNKLIEALGKKIKEEKSWVKFGISPFGVWRNSDKDPDGSATRAGQTNYDDLFADVLLWQRKGWIDYLLPQLYWEKGHKAADYDELIRWWSRHAYGRHLYIGHGIYQVGTSKKACWNSMTEIENQVNNTRTVGHIQGSAFYSAVAFKKDLCGLNYHMRYSNYPTLALLPTMPWIDSIAPSSPKVSIDKDPGGFSKIKWTVDNPSKEKLRFAVYRIPKGQSKSDLKASFLLAITDDYFYVDRSESKQACSYVVTALDRLNNESLSSNVIE